MSPAKVGHSSNFKVSPNSRVGGAGPVNAVFRQRSAGLAEVSIGIDYSKANPPELSYVADQVEVMTNRSGYVIKFGKLTSDEKGLRTRVEIVFPQTMFQNQLIQSSRTFLTDISQAENLRDVSDSPKFNDPEKLQTFQANNVMLGAWGDEGVADFYYLSPGDFAFAANGQLSDIRLVPALRVTMDLQLLKDFLAQCHKFDANPSATEARA